MFLRQSTASQTRMVGPFIDDTDFKTLETGLTINNTDIKLSKNGAASVNKNSGGATHNINGRYYLTFDATDSDTVGELDLSISVAGALVVFTKFFVLEEAVYDALFASGATGSVDVGSINGSVNAAVRLALSAGQIIPGTVEDSTTTPTTTTFAASDITEATNDHFNGRIIIFTSGALVSQATDITDYTLTGGEGVFTVTQMTEAPADGDTFIIV